MKFPVMECSKMGEFLICLAYPIWGNNKGTISVDRSLHIY